MTEKGRRQFRVGVRVSYAGGSLAEEDRQALRHALFGVAPGYSLSVSSGLYDAVEIAGTLYEENALRAAGQANRVLDEALMRTGLYEQFDVSGKSLEVQPAERADGQ
jgi:lipid-binding SYLF domain-containing protein